MQTIEGEIVESVWNLKAIAIGVVSLSSVAVGGYIYKDKIFPPPQQTSVSSKPSHVSEEVKGESTQKDEDSQNETYTLPSFSTLGADVQKKVAAIQQQANNLNAQEIASSSPQVQKILEDLKNVQNLPRNQAKEICENICKGL